MQQSPSASSSSIMGSAAAPPNVYLRIVMSQYNSKPHYYSWYKLDFEHEKPVLMGWKFKSASQYYGYDKVVAIKSEIYSLCLTSSSNTKFYNDVHRINTAKDSCFESAPSMLSNLRSSHVCTIGDKILIFYNRTDNDEHIMEIFDRSSDKWLAFLPEELQLPREFNHREFNHWWLLWFVADHENERVLMYKCKGIYAFYPESFKWEYLYPWSDRSYQATGYSQSKVLLNGILYYFVSVRNIYKLEAMDMANGLKPLKIVWPDGFDHRFFNNPVSMNNAIDLGNHRLCIVAQNYEYLHPFGCNYDSDEYYYSDDDDDENAAERQSCEDMKKLKKRLVITCLVLEFEKEGVAPQPDWGLLRRKTRLLVKTASTFCFKFGDDFVYDNDSFIRISNVLVD